MSSIDSIGTPSTTSTPATGATDRTALGKDDFLKLLATQLQHQDPLKPMDDMQFIGQMAQFSTLEQITNLRDGLDQLTFSGQVGQSVGLIGHTVSFTGSDGQPAEGVASAVSFANGQISIKVGDLDVSPNQITGVR